MSLRIEHLFLHRRHVPLVAGWIYDEFWRGKDVHTPATLEAALREAKDPDTIPLSLLALDDDDPAGTVNLIHSDSSSRPDLHPWLAALVVTPGHRHRGIGSALCRALVAEAARLGIPELYLGTDIPSFYSRLGAETFEVLDSGFIMRFLPGGSVRSGS